jgi:hypothetical protein
MKHMLTFMMKLYGKDSKMKYKTFCVKRLAALFLGKSSILARPQIFSRCKSTFFAHQEF